MVDSRKIIVALDFERDVDAVNLARQLPTDLCRVKIGKEMFTRYGPGLVEQIAAQGHDIFLDLKFHDIPNTVAGAVKSAAALGVWMVNVHASGGRAMMEAARNALAGMAGPAPLLTAVTILTSLSESEIAEVGFNQPPATMVERLAGLAQTCGMDGVVCSPLEAKLLKQALGEDFLLVTPGVRPAGSVTGDQQRIMTPKDALVAGSDYLVIGRPITASQDPVGALAKIVADMG